MKNILCLSLCLFSTTIQAAPDRYSFLAGSYHVNEVPGVNGGDGFNGFNPGLFATWDRAPFDWSVGVYLNSYRRVSVAATVALPIYGRENFAVDLFAGAAWYPEDGRTFGVHVGDVIPIGGLQVRYRNLFVQVIPSDGVYTDAILSFGVTWQ